MQLIAQVIVLIVAVNYAQSLLTLGHKVRFWRTICNLPEEIVALGDKYCHQCHLHLPEKCMRFEYGLRMQCNAPYASETEVRHAVCKNPEMLVNAMDCAVKKALVDNNPIPVLTDHEWKKYLDFHKCKLDGIQSLVDLHNYIFV